MSSSQSNLFDPTDEHRMLREMVRDFTQIEVEPQAAEFDEKQCLNQALMRKLGEIKDSGIEISISGYSGAAASRNI